MSVLSDQVSDAPVDVVPNAIVVPPVAHRYKQAAGVLTAEGAYVEQGATRRLNMTLTVEPKRPDVPLDFISGRWLWGGLLFDHFGHFMVESQSRIWNATCPTLHIDGIAFIPKSPRRGPELMPFQRDTFVAWGIEQSVRIVSAPTSFEALLVPNQGIGLGQLIGATPDMRSAAQKHFARDISAEGPERLYVSRSALPRQQGMMILEPFVEQALAQDGYAVFHPQTHDIRTQIARYKAARQIIFADGSPAHLFAYVARPDQKVAYLPRRKEWSDGPIDHIAAFAGQLPMVLPGPTRIWRAKDRKAFRNVSYSTHDLVALGTELFRAGMIETASAWINPDAETLEAMIGRTVPSGLFVEEPPV